LKQVQKILSQPMKMGVALFYTALTDVDAVSHALPNYGFTLQSAQLGYRPKNPVTLNRCRT
jgi:transcriptional/translational regulatory protein YebC/TACO1